MPKFNPADEYLIGGDRVGIKLWVKPPPVTVFRYFLFAGCKTEPKKL